VSWSAVYKVSALPEPLQQAYRTTLEWMRELGPHGEQKPCIHRSPIIDGKVGLEFILETDASLLGWGWSLQMRPSESADVVSLTELAAAAGRWSARESVYHSNRRELIALWRGLQFTVSFLEYYSKSRSPARTCSLTIKSDNVSTVQWSSGKRPSKALEARAIQRLASVIEEELEMARTLASVTITHVPGVLNVRADRLSRLLERKCGTLSPACSLGK
ncbi:hypothetical protein FOL46_004208, partial [Perkinsus olseni]